MSTKNGATPEVPPESEQIQAGIVTLKRKRTGHVSQLSQLYTACEALLGDFSNYNAVMSTLQKIKEQWSLVTTVHQQVKALIQDDTETAEYQKTYDTHYTNYSEHLQRCEQYFDARNERLENKSITSTKSAKIRRALAELQLKQLEQQQTLDAEAYMIQQKKTRQEAIHGLEKARLAEELSLHGDGSINQDDECHDKGVKLNPNAPVFVSQKQSIEGMVSAIENSLNFPKPNILYFDGSSENYQKFIKCFDTNIGEKQVEYNVKLNYLIQFCTGRARESIENCVMLESKEGYMKAREILHSRFGQAHVIARVCIDKIVNGPVVKPNDIEALTQLHSDMTTCLMTLSSMNYMSDLNNTNTLRQIVKRLPFHIRAKWLDQVDNVISRGQEPDFEQLLNFIDKRVRVSNSVYGHDMAFAGTIANSKPKGAKPPVNSKTKVTTLLSNVNNGSNKKVLQCIFCNEKHKVLECKKFVNETIENKVKIVNQNNLCANCFMFKHNVNDCKKPSMCTIPGCENKHHTVMHEHVSNNKVECGNIKIGSNMSNVSRVCLKVVPVNVKSKTGNKCVTTYALLDDGSNATLCSEQLIDNLGIKAEMSAEFTVNTVNQSKDTRGHVVSLNVSPLNNSENVELQYVRSVKKLPISLNVIPKQRDLAQWSHLSDLNIPEINSDDIQLLIGSDTPEVFWSLEERRGNRKEPIGIKTLLGWTVMGPVNSTATSTHVDVNFQYCEDPLFKQVERMWTSEFEDGIFDNAKGMSQEDCEALEIMKNTIRQKDGKYQIKLPLKQTDCEFPIDNKSMAEARLRMLKRKLLRDPELASNYNRVMNEYIQKGYAQKVSKESNESAWYLPHHPVMNKSGKTRIVFDCAASYKGVSLNSQLLQGPDLLNSLVGVLIRFRQDPIAIVSDIESMYHQVKVYEEDTNLLRFLWWPNGDMNTHPEVYSMTVHLFGATSSPSCAAYALKKTAYDNKDIADPEIVSTIERDFYVDDCLKSVPSVSKGIKCANELQKVLYRGGFRLTKWLSNSPEVIQSIDEGERAKSLVNFTFDRQLPHSQKTLGVEWNVQSDIFCFNYLLNEKSTTRRGILSIASSLYDPLGFIAPVTLIPKFVLQDSCRLGLGWDDPLPDSLVKRYDEWLENLPCLSEVGIDRCFKPKDLNPKYNVELHYFSDASQKAYAVASYLRIWDIDGHCKNSLILGKSRLAPIKNVTMPRLELAAAALSCKVHSMITRELKLNVDNVVFWTDSTIVLGYIRNKSKRFKTYVANRLSVIHENSKPEQWRHIASELNPADIGSRGLMPSNIDSLHAWINGPEFLQLPDADTADTELPQTQISDVTADDCEVMGDITTCTLNVKLSATLQDVFNKYSSWPKLTRAVAWLSRFAKYIINKRDVKVDHLSVDEIAMAEHSILSYVQKQVYDIKNEDVSRVARNRLSKLNPIVKDGLLLVGGRLQKSSFAHQKQHPIILPSKHHVTRLIIRNIHESNGHVGPQHVLSHSREKYWIEFGLSAIKRVINRCLDCKRRNQKPMCQQMAPLPAERVTPDKPPFTFVGVDYFGPLTVKQGRKQYKRYGCIFTCLTTRAVHLEIAHSLDTDSFLGAVSRFISRRGKPLKIFSDNGTNLVRGERELRECIEEWNEKSIHDHMLQKAIDWKFNPPHASHMGGIWERMVQSTKKILKALVKEQILTDEGLHTLMVEVERILNDRPLTPVSDNSSDLQAITPNNILLLRDNSCFAPGVFVKEDMYLKRWWRQAQHIANQFWKRWVNEYVPLLQQRSKWLKKQRNVKCGDLVLVVEDTLPRGQWPLGRVVEVFPSSDGLIRSVKVKTAWSEKIRPITKLCFLESDLTE